MIGAPAPSAGAARSAMVAAGLDDMAVGPLGAGPDCVDGRTLSSVATSRGSRFDDLAVDRPERLVRRHPHFHDLHHRHAHD